MANQITYDVFLSHNSQDKPQVEALVHRLSERGLTPFLDKWCLVPGDPWQEAIEKALQASASCAVFLGPATSAPGITRKCTPPSTARPAPCLPRRPRAATGRHPPRRLTTSR
jgi:hypothetical protein